MTPDAAGLGWIVGLGAVTARLTMTGRPSADQLADLLDYVRLLTRGMTRQDPS